MQKQFLVCLTVLSMQGLGMGAGSGAAGGRPSGLRIEVLAGEGSVNSLTTPNVIAPVVRVRNAEGAPVEGARVRFELAASPARGVFAGDKLALDTETNSRGEAAAWGYVPRREGAFLIKVTASSRNESAAAGIRQRNGRQAYAIVRGRTSWRRRAVVTAAAAAAATGVLLAVRPKQPSRVTITLGPPSSGGVR